MHFYVFPLEPVTTPADAMEGDEPPVAVFIMHPELRDPVSAVVVTPQPGGAEVEIRDLRSPDSSYLAPTPA